ncbi:MAG: epoxide hydrolase family protein [Propionibacteriaceae bacterium]
MTGAEVVPYEIATPESDLEDLRDRLRRTRWPERETVDDWSQGVPLDYLQELCRYWAEDYDWRRVEDRLNGWPHFRTEIDGLGLHFLHVRSPHPEAVPLVMTHGWPGSVIEFLDVIGPLTDPPAYGGDAADAFHLVCPSLPGYGFSDKPRQPGWGVDRIANAWARLMKRLGYDRYGAQGGDWGTSVSTELALHHPERIIGLHLNPPLAPPDPDTFDDLTEQEQRALDSLQHAQEWEDGYSAEQSTRPQTIGYALVDSPVALCAWIVEKFRAWTDCDGTPENALTRDQMLDDITLYWLTGTGASSARLYWESIRSVQQIFTSSAPETVSVPTGCSLFPAETIRPSRRWAAKRFTDIRFWHELDRGGHFGAFEQPELFVADVRDFFRQVR